MNWTLGRLVRRIWLWTKLVWREWEPASSRVLHAHGLAVRPVRSGGIPKPYRSHYRFNVVDAWEIAKIIHPSNSTLAISRPPNAGVEMSKAQQGGKAGKCEKCIEIEKGELKQ